MFFFNRNHLSSNLFFLYIFGKGVFIDLFPLDKRSLQKININMVKLNNSVYTLLHIGKLVEEEEGNFALWLSYILTGAGANLVSWLILPRNAVSVGASGAVFGLFAISVLVKVIEFNVFLFKFKGLFISRVFL